MLVSIEMLFFLKEHIKYEQQLNWFAEYMQLMIFIK